MWVGVTTLLTREHQKTQKNRRLAGASLLGAFHVPGQARARRADGQWTKRNGGPIELVALTRRATGVQRLLAFTRACPPTAL